MRILAAVGDDAAARSVVATAVAVADRLGWEARAVHVGEKRDGAASAIVEGSGLEVEVLGGDPGEAILERLHDPGVGAVVVGARREPSTGTGIGGTARALATGASVPVVVVPAAAVPMTRLDRVAIAVDGGDVSAGALRDAVALLAASAVEIVLVHVPFGDAIPPFEDQVGHETESWSTELIRRHCEVPGANVRLLLGRGEPAAELLRVADAEHVDLIGLGWRQVLEPGRARLVAHVLERARIPVALYPAASAVEPPGRGLTA